MKQRQLKLLLRRPWHALWFNTRCMDNMSPVRMTVGLRNRPPIMGPLCTCRHLGTRPLKVPQS
ncbi:hypothetical protein SKAU_G00012290 [Synaphobranchus kaupii]|uniref:Uncharacterized protein n=1 Tax=Synaphobranchus kaupii TaxID=118154 RepID=A0A9Q1GBE7_SYNKA|nr:hypothetical protein SKAU_G00012290 [Synaphobranchus kaupii]